MSRETTATLKRESSGTVKRPRCKWCGRLAGWNAYFAQWWCNHCERKIQPEEGAR